MCYKYNVFTGELDYYEADGGPLTANQYDTDSGSAIPAANILNILGDTALAGTSPLTTTGSGNTVTVLSQMSQDLAAADATKVGLCNFDSAAFSVDADGFVTLKGGLDNLHVARFIVSAGGSTDGANYTTIASAIAAASSGDTIFVQPGTYVEDLSMKAGVHLTAFDGDARIGNVIIQGKITVDITGTCNITGIELLTNGDTALEITGTNTSSTILNSCYILAADATAITCDNSSASLTISNSYSGALPTFTMFSITTILGMTVFNTRTSSPDATASNIAAGTISWEYCILGTVSTTSGTGQVQVRNSRIQMPTNTTFLTTAGTGTSRLENNTISTGTAASVSIGAGTTVVMTDCDVISSNANPITGAGTLEYTPISFAGTGTTVDTTTQTPLEFGPTILTTGIKNDGFHVDNVTALDDTDSDYTALASDYMFSCDVSGGVLTIDLPDAPDTGRTFVVKDIGGDANTNNITITTVGGVVTIDGAATFVMNTNYQSTTLIFNGTSYAVI